MSEEAPQIQNQTDEAYLAQQPHAVTNSELAELMGHAGDPHETEAANLRLEATQKLGEAAFNRMNSQIDGTDVGNTVIRITKAN